MELVHFMAVHYRWAVPRGIISTKRGAWQMKWAAWIRALTSHIKLRPGSGVQGEVLGIPLLHSCLLCHAEVIAQKCFGPLSCLCGRLNIALPCYCLFLFLVWDDPTTTSIISLQRFAITHSSRSQSLCDQVKPTRADRYSLWSWRKDPHLVSYANPGVSCTSLSQE